MINFLIAIMLSHQTTATTPLAPTVSVESPVSTPIITYPLKPIMHLESPVVTVVECGINDIANDGTCYDYGNLIRFYNFLDDAKKNGFDVHVSYPIIP